MKPNQAGKPALGSLLFAVLFMFAAPFPGDAHAPEAHSIGPPDSLPLQIPSGGLKVGERVPEEIWHLPLQVVNHPEGRETITLNDYRGKLIILDFWATWCGSCIAAMPKMDSLRSAFRGKIEVLAVTAQGREMIGNFVAERSMLRSLKLPFVVDDSVLKSLFPHQMIPHLVWIDPQGSYRGSTWATDANVRVINSALDRGEFVFSEFKEDQLDYDSNAPLLLAGNGGDSENFLFRSLITKYIGSIPGNRGRRETENSFRLYAYNASLSGLYRHALNRNYWPENRIIWEGRNAQAYHIDDWEEEKHAKTFCYELIIPPAIEPYAYDIMVQDLNRFFRVRGRLETRTVDCWLLVLTGGGDLLRTKGGPPDYDFRIRKEAYSFMVNQPLQLLAEHLNKLLPLPVVNETNHRGTVDLILRANLTDIPALRNELRKYGLDLLKTQRKMEMLIISEHINQ